jgi:Holliday junction resolvase RusA-like endonuclease
MTLLYEATFPINPVAASRPRVTTKGHSYYAGPYKNFRKDIQPLIEELAKGFVPLVGPLSVDVDIWVQRPKSTKLLSPRADIDNYLKAIFDSFNGILWEDDSQITIVHAMKAWTESNEVEGSFDIRIEKDWNFDE